MRTLKLVQKIHTKLFTQWYTQGSLHVSCGVFEYRLKRIVIDLILSVSIHVTPEKNKRVTLKNENQFMNNKKALQVLWSFISLKYILYKDY